jgi:hypothetical protein
MKKLKINAYVFAVLTASSLPALAASSVDVYVKGTITPAACLPSLLGGGAADYGAIKPESLEPADEYTILPIKQVDFTIICDAPAKVAIKPIAGRIGSVAGVASDSGFARAPAGVNLFDNTPGHQVTGLGLDGTTKIGGYSMRSLVDSFSMNDGSSDTGVALVNIYSTNKVNWNVTGPTNGMLGNTMITSWAEVGTALPVAITTLSGKFEVHAYLNKASELDLTKPISLDGLTSLELVYL